MKRYLLIYLFTLLIYFIASFFGNMLLFVLAFIVAGGWYGKVNIVSMILIWLCQNIRFVLIPLVIYVLFKHARRYNIPNRIRNASFVIFIILVLFSFSQIFYGLLDKIYKSLHFFT